MRLIGVEEIAGSFRHGIAPSGAGRGEGFLAVVGERAELRACLLVGGRRSLQIIFRIGIRRRLVRRRGIGVRRAGLPARTAAERRSASFPDDRRARTARNRTTAPCRTHIAAARPGRRAAVAWHLPWEASAGWPRARTVERRRGDTRPSVRHSPAAGRRIRVAPAVGIAGWVRKYSRTRPPFRNRPLG